MAEPAKPEPQLEDESHKSDLANTSARSNKTILLWLGLSGIPMAALGISVASTEPKSALLGWGLAAFSILNGAFLLVGYFTDNGMEKIALFFEPAAILFSKLGNGLGKIIWAGITIGFFGFLAYAFSDMIENNPLLAASFGAPMLYWFFAKDKAE